MKEEFNLFGFKVKTKVFILGLLIGLAVYMFLLGVDLLGWADVSWYGVFIGTGFILAVIIASELARERGVYKDMPYDLIWLVFPFAIIGARVFYVINALDEFDGFIDMISIWKGGLSIFGGVIGGIVAVLVFAWIKKINPLKIMDIAAPVLILGQAIGRWGNFINKEVYGLEITNSAFQWFPVGVNIDGTWHLALFFYESMISLVGFFVLVYILRHSKSLGIVAFSYLTWYGVVRAGLEFLREPQYILTLPGTTLPASAITSAIMALVGIAGLVWIFVRSRQKSR